MADGDSVAAATGDAFAGAKANLRDTVKWLTTALAALATVVLAGSPLTGLGSLTDWRLALALLGAGVGLACVIAAIAVTLGLLMSESFTLSELARDSDLNEFFNERAVDLLPPEYATLKDLVEERTRLARELHEAADKDNLAEHVKWAAAFRSIDTATGRIVSLGHFERLRRNLKRRTPCLFLLLAVGVPALGLFAWAANPKKAGEPASARSEWQVGLLETSANWGAVAKGLTDSCGGAAVVRVQMRNAALPGWLEVQLLAPEKCAGARLMLPAQIKVLPAAP